MQLVWDFWPHLIIRVHNTDCSFKMQQSNINSCYLDAIFLVFVYLFTYVITCSYLLNVDAVYLIIAWCFFACFVLLYCSFLAVNLLCTFRFSCLLFQLFSLILLPVLLVQLFTCLHILCAFQHLSVYLCCLLSYSCLPLVVCLCLLAFLIVFISSPCISLLAVVYLLGCCWHSFRQRSPPSQQPVRAVSLWCQWLITHQINVISTSTPRWPALASRWDNQQGSVCTQPHLPTFPSEPSVTWWEEDATWCWSFSCLYYFSSCCVSSGDL